jgi:hypothetical protein
MLYHIDLAILGMRHDGHSALNVLSWLDRTLSLRFLQLSAVL